VEKLYYRKEIILERAKILKKYKLSVFREKE